MRSNQFQMHRKKCFSAVSKFHGHGTVTKAEQGAISQMRKLLLSRMAQIVFNCGKDERPDAIGAVYHALKALHPRTEYTCGEKVVRDLADVLLTLKNIETGVGRKSEEKISEAATFLGLLRKDPQAQ